MSSDTTNPADDKYRVVALRYRPGDFNDLIGQSQVATALSNAITQNRVGHAYLFTGARGVGKTSSARIFSKCLNCVKGPTTQPCGECDICEGVASGEDVDVLEIDGASNRGIDEIRQLRANANVRPSRARYKIYIIDEVHMLTTAAFNALLKTLEEPPGHVKFIFCTTDPEKIPITVLSRCQRFDFPPIKTQSIVGRLRHIVDLEGIEAEDQALELLARRAGGSMRDSQSLLEQLLSYTSSKITVAEVHSLLGTADNDTVFEIAEAIVANDSARALNRVHASVETGVDAGQLTEQLLGLFRDTMATLVGCTDELLLYSSSDDMPQLKQLAESLGVERVLSILQVLDQTLVKVRHSTYVRTLLETSIVRCCHLQNIDQIPDLIRQLQSGPANASSGDGNSAAAKKKAVVVSRVPSSPMATEEPANQSQPVKTVEMTPDSKSDARFATNIESNSILADPVTNETVSPVVDPVVEASHVMADRETEEPKVKTQQSSVHDGNVESIWVSIMSEFNDLTGEAALNFESVSVLKNQLVVTLKSKMDLQLCGQSASQLRIEQATKEKTGHPFKVKFIVSDKPTVAGARKPKMLSPRQRAKKMEQNEFVKAAMDLFDAEVTDVQAPIHRSSKK